MTTTAANLAHSLRATCWKGDTHPLKVSRKTETKKRFHKRDTFAKNHP